MFNNGGNMFIIRRIKPATERFKNAMMLAQQISEKEMGEPNPFHNYRWRENLQKEILQKNGLDIKDVSGVTGDDFCGKDIKKGDYKSSKCNYLKNGFLSRSKGKFEFDKQNDPVKRKATMKYDCLLFSWFVEFDCVASVLIKGKDAIEDFQKMTSQKLASFVKLMEKKEKEGKRVPRDSITFDYYDTIQITGARYFSGDKEVSLEQFKQIFGD